MLSFVIPNFLWHFKVAQKFSNPDFPRIENGSANQINVNVPIMKKPVKWFTMSTLVSMWWGNVGQRLKGVSVILYLFDIWTHLPAFKNHFWEKLREKAKSFQINFKATLFKCEVFLSFSEIVPSLIQNILWTTKCL